MKASILFLIFIFSLLNPSRVWANVESHPPSLMVPATALAVSFGVAKLAGFSTLGSIAAISGGLAFIVTSSIAAMGIGWVFVNGSDPN